MSTYTNIAIHKCHTLLNFFSLVSSILRKSLSGFIFLKISGYVAHKIIAILYFYGKKILFPKFLYLFALFSANGYNFVCFLYFPFSTYFSYSST